ncbi:outer membrane lipoprotein-sorting protein [Thalassotalea sediminis]|uniref:outer membrane lipoprotein-sorting protein n=1 Tax=Thalassotalea sediminis TaxID=1759089 RepID=UPI002572D62F|nr:outer membrane lipoprotein-sorting protein [Thalassotalea sediminis]
MNFITKYTTLLLLPISALVSAEALTVEQIISKANIASYYAGDDGRAEARMMIVDQNGNKQMRQFSILRKDIEDEGQQKMLVIFSRPTDVKGTVFSVEKHIKQDDNRWLYLPALDLVKRISAGDKRTSFVGSHFYYEDVSGRNPNEDNFTLSETTDKLYILDATPKDPTSVEFAHYQVKIDKTTFIPLEATYFDQNNKAIRKMTVKKTQSIQGYETVVHSRIEQLSDGSFTEMQFRNVEYNLQLPAQIFTERSLRNPPIKWLK